MSEDNHFSTFGQSSVGFHVATADATSYGVHVLTIAPTDGKAAAAKSGIVLSLMDVRGRLLPIANIAVWGAAIAGLLRDPVPLDAFGWDLGIFRVASRMLASGRALYDFDEQSRAHLEAFGHTFRVQYPYAYPPILAIETMPLAWIPQFAAFVIVALSSVALLVWCARKITGDARDALWVTIAFPAMLAIEAGQLVFFALGVLTASLLLVRASRPIAAGLVLSLLAYKPQLLAVLPFAFVIVPSMRRGLFGLAAGVLAQVALCFALAFDATLAFPSAPARMLAYTDMHFRASLSFTWRAFFSLLLPSHASLALGLAITAMTACFAIAIAAMVRAQKDPSMVFAIAVMATLACAWHCQPYEWVLLALPAWLLVERANLSAWAQRALVLAFVSMWGWLAFVDGQQARFGIAIHPAMIVLTVAAIWTVRRACNEQSLLNSG